MSKEEEFEEIQDQEKKSEVKSEEKPFDLIIGELDLILEDCLKFDADQKNKIRSKLRFMENRLGQ